MVVVLKPNSKIAKLRSCHFGTFWRIMSFFVQKIINVTFLILTKKIKRYISDLRINFWTKRDKFFIRCQNDGCKVLQLYYSVSKQAPTFLYEIINSKREKKPTKIYENHKIAKLFLLCSLEGYGQHFMSRSLSTKMTVSSTWSFWYNIVLDEICLIF